MKQPIPLYHTLLFKTYNNEILLGKLEHDKLIEFVSLDVDGIKDHYKDLRTSEFVLVAVLDNDISNYTIQDVRIYTLQNNPILNKLPMEDLFGIANKILSDYKTQKLII